MSEAPPTTVRDGRAALDSLATHVQWRLFVIEWLAALRRWVWVPWLSLPAVLLAYRWMRADAVALSLVMIWLAVAAGVALRRRRTPYGALAEWDAAGGHPDALSSAHVFAHEPGVERDPGRLLHLHRTADALPAARSRLARDLPIPRHHAIWLAPVAAIGFSLLPWWQPPVDPADQPLTQAQQAAAADEAAALAADDEAALNPMTELTDQERQALEELARTQQELAEALKHTEGKSPRDVLDELEKQARAAEALAQQLGADANAWASEKLLAAMRQHPDTAGLAEAVLAKNPAQAAEEARTLATTLKAPDLTSEVAERHHQSLDQAISQAGAIEPDKPVDQAAAAAAENLEITQPAAAGEAFDKLADTFARQHERDQARQELEKLAQRLREAGSSIMGQHGEGMKKLAGASGESGTSPMPTLQPLSAADPSATATDLPIPNHSSFPDMQPGDPAARRGTPIPGTGPPPKDAKPLAAIPGTGGKNASPLALAAPIPGTAPGRGGTPIPIPGASGSGPPAAGGTLPGHGVTESGNKPTEITPAAAQGEVAAAPGNAGESFTQSIDGQPREEAVARAAQRSAAAFLKEQEQALDTENLPPARREQIRRYFESIRKKVGE